MGQCPHALLRSIEEQALQMTAVAMMLSHAGDLLDIVPMFPATEEDDSDNNDDGDVTPRKRPRRASVICRARPAKIARIDERSHAVDHITSLPDDILQCIVDRLDHRSAWKFCRANRRLIAFARANAQRLPKLATTRISLEKRQLVPSRQLGRFCLPSTSTEEQEEEDRFVLVITVTTPGNARKSLVKTADSDNTAVTLLHEVFEHVKVGESISFDQIQITDELMELVASQRDVRQLTQLNFNFCSFEDCSGDALRRLLSSARRFHSLAIDFCKDLDDDLLSDETFQSVSGVWRSLSLQASRLTRLANFTDATLEAWFKRKTAPANLVFRHFEAPISLGAIQAVMETLPHLHTGVVSWTVGGVSVVASLPPAVVRLQQHQPAQQQQQPAAVERRQNLDHGSNSSNSRPRAISIGVRPTTGHEQTESVSVNLRID